MLFTALSCSLPNNSAKSENPTSKPSNIIFQCSAENGKTIKALKEPIPNESKIKITYDFANPSKTEMSFSETALPGSFKKFSYNSYSRYRTRYIRLNFSRSDYQYSIYSDYDESLPIKEERGVIVKKRSTGNEIKIKCSTTDIDKLEDVSTLLNCNQDSALGCL